MLVLPLLEVLSTLPSSMWMEVTELLSLIGNQGQCWTKTLTVLFYLDLLESKRMLSVKGLTL